MLKRIFFTLFTLSAFAQVAPISRPRITAESVDGIHSQWNLLPNPQFDKNVAKWGASTGTLASTSTAAQVRTGPKAMKDSFTTSDQITMTQSINVPNGLMGLNGEGFCWMKASTTGITATASYTDGTTVIAGKTMTLFTDRFVKVQVNFPFGLSGTAEVYFDLASGGAVDVYIDDCYMGEATNLSQANNNTDWKAYTPTLTNAGNASAYFSWRRSGQDMLVKGTIVVGSTIPSGGSLRYALPSGYTASFADLPKGLTNADAYQAVGKGAVYSSASVKKTDFTVTRLSNSTTTFYGAIGDGTTYSSVLDIGPTAGPFNFVAGDVLVVEFKVPIVGWETETAVRSEDSGLTDWVTYDPTLTWVAGISTKSARWKRVGDSMMIYASLTLSGAPTATALEISIPSSYTIDTAKLPNTSSMVLGSSTILDSGTTRYSCTVRYATTTAARVVCGSTNDVTDTSPITFAVNDVVSVFFTVPITGWDYTVPAPVLVGSVTSNSVGAERIERAILVCSGSSSITSQSGAWISSIGNIATGKCAVTITSGIFSATPTCYINKKSDPNSAALHAPYANASSSTNVNIGLVYILSGSATVNYGTSDTFDLICMGPR